MVFDSVDIALPIEKVVDGNLVPLALLIKETNHKAAHEIQNEIDAALGLAVVSEKDYVLNKHSLSKASMDLYYRNATMDKASTNEMAV